MLQHGLYKLPAVARLRLLDVCPSYSFLKCQFLVIPRMGSCQVIQNNLKYITISHIWVCPLKRESSMFSPAESTLVPTSCWIPSLAATGKLSPTKGEFSTLRCTWLGAGQGWQRRPFHLGDAVTCQDQGRLEHQLCN